MTSEPCLAFPPQSCLGGSPGPRDTPPCHSPVCPAGGPDPENEVHQSVWGQRPVSNVAAGAQGLRRPSWHPCPAHAGCHPVPAASGKMSCEVRPWAQEMPLKEGEGCSQVTCCGQKLQAVTVLLQLRGAHLGWWGQLSVPKAVVMSPQ